jgi:two-component system, OmpR family, sensor histidine kinase KdpD
MSDSERPDPDILLASLKRTEKAGQRGFLKIFFGMAAGVGKTYAMLKAAQALKKRGVSVVVGYVETHGRAETDALLFNLPVIPRTTIHYKGRQLEDMDLDAVLAQKPEYVLVDELAHTNAEGMRHAKRYQDVLELIDNGISVYTTLNVQHVESLVDTVRQISGISVKETVPDSVLDAADEIELVDLPPDELIARLKEGKVYAPDRSTVAASNFFRKGNLTALREIALRKTAERVDSQLRDYMQEHRISGPWKTVERLMVAIGPSPYSEQLIRWTRRIAATMEASWVAVYVGTPRPLSDEAEKRLKKNIALAEELGAELVSTNDDDIARALLRVGRQYNATQIVIGKSMTSPLRDLVRGGSLVDRLIRESGGIDIYVVQSDLAAPQKKLNRQLEIPGTFSPLRQYVVSCCAVLGAIVACYLSSRYIDYRSVGMFLLFIISVLSLFFGRGPLFAAALVSAVAWDFLFIPPVFTFSISRPSDVMMVSLFFMVALASGILTSRIRIKESVVRRREVQTSTLYSFVNELAAAEDINEIAKTGVKGLGTVFNAKVAFFLPGTHAAISTAIHPSSTFGPGSEKELSVAEWVFANKKPAGHGTSTLQFADAVYYPLAVHGNCIGVVGLVPSGRATMTSENEALLMMFLHQWAFALDRAVLREQAARTRLLEESERLNKTLLNSISHELRTPLAEITGASSGLLEAEVAEDPKVRTILVGDIKAASSRLNRLVENLLDMTRIESGGLKITKDWCDVRDIINSVLSDLSEELSWHTVRISISDDVPLVKLDGIIVEQVLSNIVLNAAQYTPPATPIHIRSFFDAGALVFAIEDEGPGLPEESIGRIFDKFYRVPGTRAGGTGLGLSIVKGFVELHGGSVEAANRPGKGAQFIIRLPVEHKPFLTDEAS